MPLKLTVEVPDEMVADLDALAELYGETREAFATQSVKFCVKKGAEVEFFRDLDVSTYQDALAAYKNGETISHEEFKRELEGRLEAESRQRLPEAAE